jgi:hypothetical protein
LLFLTKFGEKEFSFDQAEKLLGQEGLNVFLSDLRKAGWATVSLDEKDTRKRKYALINPEKIFSEIINK